MKLFSKYECRQFLDNISNNLEDDINKLTDSEIINVSIQEWTEYFVSKYSIELIEVYTDKISLDVVETKIKKYNSWSRHLSYEPEYFYVDGYKITIRIPFFGDEELLSLRPSTYYLSQFDIEKVTSNKINKEGFLYYVMEYTRDELPKEENIKDLIFNTFNNRFRDYKHMIENVNKDIVPFNLNLENKIISNLKNRKDRCSDFINIKKALEIPLNLKENSLNLNPIPLERVKKVEKPKVNNKFSEPEYSISEENYNYILKIIHNTCSSMENAARTFNKNSEEELRDFIIATLSSHYTEQVTGETFRKIGKTDIHIVFENKSAFISECKIWHGLKHFEDAIDQIFGYSTWKDNKISVIIFNKKNKDFQGILSTVNDWVKGNTKSFIRENSNFWKCIVYREDTNVDIKISIQVYDICI